MLRLIQCSSGRVYWAHNLRRPNAIPIGVEGNELTNQNPPLALPTPSHIPLTWYSGTEVVTSVLYTTIYKVTLTFIFYALYRFFIHFGNMLYLLYYFLCFGSLPEYDEIYRIQYTNEHIFPGTLNRSFSKK
jgi:hypothetical protein